MFASSSSKMILALAVTLPCFAGLQSAEAQSLFDRRSPIQMNQLRAITATRKGDLLTVQINEATDVENIDLRSLDKSGSSSVTGDLSYGLTPGLGSTTGSGTLSQNSSSARAFSGDSEFRSERQFTDRFTVVVTDVLPNGNLVIAGERKIALHGDTRKLILTGIVRTFDLLPGNTVPSHLVANLSISLEGKGPEQKFVKQGWFSKRVNRLWPF
jgi:flagellar L-ring protein precursor FlgH